MHQRYAIALGSNRPHHRYGLPDHVVAAALRALEARGIRIELASRVIRTAALGPAGRGFANAAAIVRTSLAPPELLALLKAIERDFGRRPGRRWGARVLDLDIILWTGGTWPRFPRKAKPGRLSVPHPAYRLRRFVLDPLVTIAPEWRDPISGRSVRQLWARMR
jgi:2-amino-4-hydroxy-6-hydroxymethyldihydropteridine diphosphokinase